MKVELPELETIISELTSLKTQLLEKNVDNRLVSAWYNDQQCWELKGGMALSSYRSNRYFQIKGGIPDSYVGGRKVWSRESVQEWLNVTDDQLENYHLKYKTGAKKRV